jgi:SAM-dependent methyltransferase
MQDFETINNCLLCGGYTNRVLELSTTPPANELLTEKTTQDTFPLNLMLCNECGHLQLDTIVNPNRLFKHYLYKSNTSAFNIKYFGQYAEDMIKRFDLLDRDFVVDIASNDGLFLSIFQRHNIKVLGIDPAENIAAAANADGIPTLPEFFNVEAANRIVQEYGQASLITCNNMFAHNKDLAEIVKGVKLLLSEEGSFVFEVAYAMEMLKSNTFDLVYHEHIHHHRVIPLINFFRKLGMRIYDVEYTPTHGGSIRVFVCHSLAHYDATRGGLSSFIWGETHSTGTVSSKDYFNSLVSAFTTNVRSNIADMKSILQSAKNDGKTIGVLGWPAKATLMSYVYELEKYVSYVFDDNDLKVGRYTPGKQFPVLSTADIYKHKPDYLLILAWNYAEPLMKTHSEAGCKFIVPFPKPKIV